MCAGLLLHVPFVRTDVQYTNPTWWDLASPTLRRLLGHGSIQLTDLAVLNASRQPLIQSYGVNSGVVISLRAPAVVARLDALWTQFAGTGAQELGVDFLFEDQIGARSPPHDYAFAHGFSVSRSKEEVVAVANNSVAEEYVQGWVRRTQKGVTQHGLRLMTEQGTDQLLWSEIGFHGSVQLDAIAGRTDQWWGSAKNWSPFPLATMVGRSHTLFYQHDLARATFTQSIDGLGWNLAMGFQLSANLGNRPLAGSAAALWLRIVTVVQAAVGPLAADELRSFAVVVPEANGGGPPLVTRTDFARHSVLINWSDEPRAWVRPSSAAGGVQELPPSGFELRSDALGLSVIGNASVVVVRQAGTAAAQTVLRVPPQLNSALNDH